MQKFFKSRSASVGFAINGWLYVIRTQRNAWVHAAVSVCVILISWFLRLQARDWAVLILTIAMVWTAEFLNTALEAVVDLSTPSHHPLARIGKDVGAAAVLIAAVAAVIIGLLVIGPPLYTQLSSLIPR